MPQNTIFFNKPFEFTNVKFHSFRIKGSFLKHLVVNNSSFDLPILVDSTAFDSLIIEHSSFHHAVIFKNIQVQHFSFVDNKIPSELIFVDCTFKNFFMERSNLPSDITFENCTFENVSFANTEFKKDLLLTNIALPGKVNFDSMIFHKNLKLSWIRTTTNTWFSFYNTLLPDTLDFSFNQNLTNTVDFTKAVAYDPHRKCKILLNNTDIQKVQMNYPLFKLIFPKEFSHDDKQKTYKQLLANFQGQAYKDSYRLLGIEYKRFQAKSGALGFLWWVQEYWWRYGYNKEYVFYWVFWSMLIFTFINFFAYHWLINKTYKIDNFPKVDRKKYGERIWYSFVFTAMIFFSLSLKIDRLKLNNKGGTLYIMFIYTLGLICLAYMANYVIQK